MHIDDWRRDVGKVIACLRETTGPLVVINGRRVVATFRCKTARALPDHELVKLCLFAAGEPALPLADTSLPVLTNDLDGKGSVPFAERANDNVMPMYDLEACPFRVDRALEVGDVVYHPLGYDGIVMSLETLPGGRRGVAVHWLE